jgi:hypothetical protein
MKYLGATRKFQKLHNNRDTILFSGIAEVIFRSSLIDRWLITEFGVQLKPGPFKKKANPKIHFGVAPLPPNGEGFQPVSMAEAGATRHHRGLLDQIDMDGKLFASFRCRGLSNNI